MAAINEEGQILMLKRAGIVDRNKWRGRWVDNVKYIGSREPLFLS